MFAIIPDTGAKAPGNLEVLWNAIAELAQDVSYEIWVVILILLLFVAALVAFVNWTVPPGQFDTWQRHAHRHYHRRRRHHRHPPAARNATIL